MSEETTRPISGTDVYNWYYTITDEEYTVLSNYDSGLVNQFFKFAGLPGYYAPQDALKSESDNDYGAILSRFPNFEFGEAWFTRSTEPNKIFP